MTKTTKDKVIDALKAWLEIHAMNPAQFSKKFKFPSNYLSRMLNGYYDVETGGKNTVVADSYYIRIAEIIDFDYKGEVKWQIRETPQLIQMLAYLEDAQKFGYTNVIIGQTGTGKTFITDLFTKNDPKNVFKITVVSMDNIADLIDKLLEALKLNVSGSKSKKINAITKELNKMRLADRKPIIICDESEYMKHPTLCNIKELHDHLTGKCGLVLIGTDQLLHKIYKLKNKNAPGMPQFFRRIKYGIRELKGIDTRFREFLQDIEDKKLVKFLQQGSSHGFPTTLLKHL
jgi:DNA transposition AAA+ family ATPase